MPEGCFTVSCCPPGPFEYVTEVVSGVYLHLEVDPEGGGTATSDDDRYPTGEPATVTATPAVDYSFVGWYTEGDELLSTNTVYSFAILLDTTLVAKFIHN